MGQQRRTVGMRWAEMSACRECRFSWCPTTFLIFDLLCSAECWSVVCLFALSALLFLCFSVFALFFVIVRRSAHSEGLSLWFRWRVTVPAHFILMIMCLFYFYCCACAD